MTIPKYQLTAILALITLSNAQNPLVKGEYQIEHPALPKDFDQVQLSSQSFWENFQYSSVKEFHKNWVVSEYELAEDGSDVKFKAFPGEWKLEEAYLVPGFKNDFSLVVGSSKERCSIARKLPHPIEPDTNSTFVVQYEVKLQKALECGGAYLKLLPPIKEDLSSFDHTTPFELVFGPDQCGMYTNEIHLVLRRTNPVTGESEEKFLLEAPPSKLDSPLSTLYTLVLNQSSQEFEIRVNGEVVKAGSLLSEGVFGPPLNPPKMIPNPESVKPDDWDDRAVIPDPEVQKPDDWDESEPFTIPDPTHIKPDGWDESIPEFIPNPNAQKPGFWNEAEDGEWIAPLIQNPACYSSTGCGTWKPKMVQNPKYKGNWEPPMVPNPDYKGTWESELVENPGYYEDQTPAKFEKPIGAVVFDIWSTANDIIFDNLYIGNSIEEAEKLGNKTFLPKLELEKQEIKVNEPEPEIAKPKEPEADLETRNFFDVITNFAVTKFLALDDLFKGMVAGVIMLVILGITVVGMIKFMLWSTGDSIDGKTEVEKQREQKEQENPGREAVSEKGETTATSKGSSKLISRRIVQLQSDDEYEEELEISIIEEDIE